nr:energy transducer TonB [Mucilaginibacter sp. L294]
MKKQLLVIVFISLTNLVLAQKKNTENKPRPDTIGYYMRNDHVVAYNEPDAQFIRFIIKADSGMFKVRDYYRNGHIRLVAKTAVDSANFERGTQGICYEYYNTGKRKSIKIYNKGQVVGDAVTYYPNGGLNTIENYSPQGIYLKQYLDTAGNTLADNGNGKWLKINDGKFDGFMEGPVVNGKEDGEWKRHVADTVYTIVYKQGDVISGKEFLKVKDIVFEKVEEVPSFPGGDLAFSKYISRYVRYPAIARENNIQGRVIISFVVERDGSLTDIKVVKGIGGGCDEESLRVMSLSPKWKPGLRDGKPVRVQYSIPITFAIQNDILPSNRNLH